ncbi:MAG TPA: VOC family protein [Candidatus Dormibacteraeota bacterium]|nr:VOC family protein [Candidatus Dormibacteraeota bacterium]
MLSDKPTYTTLPVADLAAAREFYEGKLGIRPLMVTEGGVMYGSGETQFFVYPSRSRPGGHTQMSWRVSDIKAEVAELKAKGVTFEHYDVPGLEMEGDIARSGPEVWTAWFKDPEGNVLGLTQIGGG